MLCEHSIRFSQHTLMEEYVEFYIRWDLERGHAVSYHNRVYALVKIFLHSEIFTHAWTKSFGMKERPSARSEKEKKPRVRTKKFPFAPGLSA